MPDPSNSVDKLFRQLSSSFEGDLRSVVLFGSVARGEAIPGVSDMNILVLLDEVTAVQLQKAAPLAQQWVRYGNTPPLVFSVEEWGGMRDTFAIEISDMQDAREVVYGDDPVSADAITPSDLRLHAERELRQTMLHLRLRMLLAANDPAELGGLLLAGLPSFSSYMRAMLRLEGEKPSNRTEEVIERAAKAIGADPAPMLQCQEARRRLRPPRVSIADPLAEGYQDFVQRLVSHIDLIPSPAAAERATP